MKTNVKAVESKPVSVILENLLSVIDTLSTSVNSFQPQDKSLTIYNPLDYAFLPLKEYCEKYFCPEARALLLGMNPGPFGMAQTGIPFGDVEMVRDWMNISSPVSKPRKEHPKRPVDGFSCKRREVSGTRLWGWARARYGLPEAFFSNFFVWNYCPLVFMEQGGANRTPDKFPKEEIVALYEYCDDALRSIVEILEPEFVIGVGKFAMKRATTALTPDRFPQLIIGDILHPSPASPKANKNWQGEVENRLKELGCIS